MRFLILRSALAGAAVALAAAGPAHAAAPAPCSGVSQITDVASDGHHPNEDVLAGWFSEAAGRLQAVIQVRQAVWEPAHDDSDAADFALLFTAGGQVRYVRATSPRGAGTTFEYGTFTRGATPQFARLGATSGEVAGGPNGTATIDVPAAISGAKLGSPFVMTWDGSDGDEPHWVDRAPGGTGPDETAFGADFVPGACGAATAPGGTPQVAVPGSGAAAGASVTAVQLTAPARVVGQRTVTVRGRVLPARAKVPVTLTRKARQTVRQTVLTGPDGRFTARVPIGERTELRASAEGTASQTALVAVRSTVRLRIKRLSGGRTQVTGLLSPRLPGRVLLLRTTSAKPAASVAAGPTGRVVMRPARLRPGRYQLVFIPSGARAERSVSSQGVIR